MSHVAGIWCEERPRSAIGSGESATCRFKRSRQVRQTALVQLFALRKEKDQFTAVRSEAHIDSKESVAKVRCTAPQLLAVELATTLAIAIESLSTTSSASFDIATFDM
jgi:hypothetical protein